MTAAQVRRVIDAVRLNTLEVVQGIEQFEATVADAPWAARAGLDASLAALRARSRRSLARSREQVAKLEDLLRRDEEVNGWKGEDREVELLCNGGE